MANGVPTLRVTVTNAAEFNARITRVLGTKAHQSITKNPALRVAIGEYLLPLINSTTVPMSKNGGSLRQHSYVNQDDGRLRWGMKYAWYVYNGIAGFYDARNYTTKGTGSYWVDLYMKKHFSTRVRKHINDLIKEYYARGLAK